MPKRGPRSPKGNQRQVAARLVSQNAYKDPWELHKQETVNRLTSGQIAKELQDKFGTFDLDVINSYTQGEVLSGGLSARCRGSLQPVFQPQPQQWEP